MGSSSGSGSCVAGYHAGLSRNSPVVIFAIADGYLCMIGPYRMVREGGGGVRDWDAAAPENRIWLYRFITEISYI
jgi:hypothetical protein